MNKIKFTIIDKFILIYFIIIIKKEKDLYNILFFNNIEDTIKKYLDNENFYELKEFIDSLKLSKIIKVNYIDICQN